ncbi:MAG: right-handed parallel beta-helix repeat-containing protein [Thermodesulfobacteriota bacterium]|nr:right-handed parallel beta-helix repeat-containing protein [Thermodesulfobacteriota bacterium]
MRTHLWFLSFSLVIFTFSSLRDGLSATYYVKNGGHDTATGLSDAEAWQTIQKVNEFAFSDGDVLCLKRGSVFSDTFLNSPQVDHFTFRAYGTGPLPHIDGSKTASIRIKQSHTIQNLIIRDIDISGMDWKKDKASNAVIERVHNLALHSLVFDGHRNSVSSEGKTAITIENCSGNITIKNCQLSNFGPIGLPVMGRDFMGLALIGIESGSYEIRDNTIHDGNADCIHLYHCSATGSVFNNILFNAGENCIDIKGSSNVHVYDNELYRTPDFLALGGSGSAGGLIVAHATGEQACSKLEINGNVFKTSNTPGLITGNAKNIDVYDNTFDEMMGAIRIGNHTEGIHIHHNLFLNPKSLMHDNGMDVGCIYVNNSRSGTQIYNNTVYNERGDCLALLAIGYSNRNKVFRNIFYQSKPNGLCLVYTGHGLDPVIYENCWFSGANEKLIKYRGKVYTQAEENEWNTIASNDRFADPLFVDPANKNFETKDATPCKTGGAVWGNTGSALSPPKNMTIH